MDPTRGDAFDRGDLVRGGVSGAVAFLLGYVLTYAWTAPMVSDSLRGVNAVAELAGSRAIPTWKAVGWLFFDAHVVATRVPTLGGGDRLVHFIAEANEGSLVLLYALPPVLVVFAGFAAARYRADDRMASAAASGATVVVGYLPVAVLSALLVAHTFGGDVRIAPDVVTTVAVAGLLYPTFFGALGGAGWYWFSASRGT